MINKITLIGRLGQEPEIKTLENGTKIARALVATSENYKDNDGNWQQNTTWHSVIFWREQADRAAANLRKGGLVYIEGKMTYRKYTDNKGAEKNFAEVVADKYRSLEPKPEAHQQEQPAQQGNARQVPVPNNQPMDDLPF